MKPLTKFIICCAFVAMTLPAFAGPEPIRDFKSSKDVKEVAQVAPPPCDWRGFYIGINGGGTFGDTEITDLDNYNVGPPDESFTFDNSGFVGGLQLGYNFQPWRRIVFGIEADAGYLGIDGDKRQPGSPGNDTFAETNGGFYATLRGRFGIAVTEKALLYATAGGIGSNFESRVEDDCDIRPCGGAKGSGSSDDFRFGWTVGGGLEYMLTCHWSIRAEYLYYNFEDETINFHQRDGDPFDFKDETDGHIVRAGLNYKF